MQQCNLGVCRASDKMRSSASSIAIIKKKPISMKASVKCRRDVEIAFVRIAAAVRYDEEDMPNDFPFRNGDVWDVVVEADTGKIVDWPAGVTHELHMKVCDEGSYYLLDASRGVIAAIEDDYVPNGVVPGSYGDYIEMTIMADGTIENWPKRLDASSFFPG